MLAINGLTPASDLPLLAILLQPERDTFSTQTLQNRRVAAVCRALQQPGWIYYPANEIQRHGAVSIVVSE